MYTIQGITKILLLTEFFILFEIILQGVFQQPLLFIKISFPNFHFQRLATHFSCCYIHFKATKLLGHYVESKHKTLKEKKKMA